MMTLTDKRQSSLADKRFLAHHFESPEQQLDAGKLGMWLFLVTEVLFFSGLFVAYAVYRSNHPEVFHYGHQFLNPSLGALNTIVLLCSSLTMAWAVRCAQLSQQRGLVRCLKLTLACGGFFLGVKAVEYSTKWHEGLLWAGRFEPRLAAHGQLSPALLVLCLPALLALATGIAGWLISRGRCSSAWQQLLLATVTTAVGFLTGTGIATTVMADPGSTPPAAVHADSGTAAPAIPPEVDPHSERPRLAGVYFSIYYAMTGVHAIHMLAGMGVIGWLLWRAAGGDFDATYFGPVDYVGLYWHLVDLVWIYLFPLLYLIH